MAAKPKPSGGWIFTFADLMALILTFFVLLLSFSTINAKKYEEIVQSFGAVFGKGTGIIPDGGMSIVRPISVSVPLPPPTQAAERQEASVTPQLPPEPPAIETEEAADAPEEEPLLTREREAARIEQLVERLRGQFAGEIGAGLVELESRDGTVRIRFRDAISFPSGGATISAGFDEVLYSMGIILGETPGKIIVSGHTDDRPIATGRFRSNWELSAARAVSVVHYLVNKGAIPKERVVAQGYADSNPIVANDTDENRAATGGSRSRSSRRPRRARTPAARHRKTVPRALSDATRRAGRRSADSVRRPPAFHRRSVRPATIREAHPPALP
ncbi:MAG: flagellar motor protein MotB [Gammaproteobacteria bacterium]|jgi:chemotaxis protein MotB